MLLKKILITLTAIFFICNPLFCAEFFFQDENYDFTITYKEKAFPGEAFFLRMLVESHKKNRQIKIKAQAELFNEKSVCKSDFYYLEPYKNHKNVTELMTGLPMWTWDKPCENSKIVITWQFNKEVQKSFEIPVIIEKKDYPSERIRLNSSLSDLVSTPSPEKKEQSKELNELISTVKSKDVYDYSNFIRPTDGKRITSEFGQTRTFIYSNKKEAPSYHCGIDFGIPEGSKITACAGGKVVMAKWRIVTGYSVIIEHLPGLYSIYYHLSELKCKEGNIVKKGDLIALSGCTGLSTGPHLHWEVRLNGVCIFPDFLQENYAFQTISKDE
ncbi:MAG: M23 family metallopeptidase [Treponema sp.]|nr:M23 family metallopeptidase [Candidatus Treponema merdequi]